jgi:Zn-dependent protease with chaperone function
MPYLVPPDQGSPTARDPGAPESGFPALPGPGPAVDARAHRARGSAAALLWAWVVGVLVLAFLALLTSGISLAVAALWPLAQRFLARRARAVLNGSCVRVGPAQLPRIHECAARFAERLGLARQPEVFVASAASANAFALRVGGRGVVVLHDEVVDACLRGGRPGALAFVIGHELAHVSLGHSGAVHAWLARIYRRLGRLDELSCDAVAARLVGSGDDAAFGLALLAAGPKLLPYLDLGALRQQAREVDRDKLAARAERASTHPLVLRRLAALERAGAAPALRAAA